MLPAYFAVLLGKLEGAVTRAEDASRAKSRFLATMSHEFRTPLNAIIGMTDLLRTTPLDAEQRDMATTTQSAAHSLLALVNDVLDIAKIEAGRFTLDEEPFDLHEQLGNLRRMLYLEAQARGLYFRLRVDPTIPTAFVGGRGPLHQILVNLTANAIKFTSEGGVLIDVRSLEQERDRARDCASRCTIPASASPRRRRRASSRASPRPRSRLSRRYGGTGLGLAIAKELTDLLQGRIGVVSALGQGSSFWIELPLRWIPPLRRPRCPLPQEPPAPSMPPAVARVAGRGARRSSGDRRGARQRLEAARHPGSDRSRHHDRRRQCGRQRPRRAILVVDDAPPVDIEALSEALDHRRPSEPVDILTLLDRRVEHSWPDLGRFRQADDDRLLVRMLRFALASGLAGGERPDTVKLVADNPARCAAGRGQSHQSACHRQDS